MGGTVFVKLVRKKKGKTIFRKLNIKNYETSGKETDEIIISRSDDDFSGYCVTKEDFLILLGMKEAKIRSTRNYKG